MSRAGAAARVGLLHAFAWRLDVVAAVVGAGLVLAMNTSLWGLAAGAAGGQVGTLDTRSLTTYVVMAWVASRITTSGVDQDLAQRVASGQVASDLLRPVGLRWWLMWREAGRAVATFLVVGGPLLLFAALGADLAPPGAWWAVPAALVSVALGVRVGVDLGFLVGITAVRLKSAAGLISVKQVALALVSGALVPLDLWPGWLRTLLVWAPSRGLADGPARVYLARGGVPEALGVIGGQVVWVVVLGLVAREAWRRLARDLTVEGG